MTIRLLSCLVVLFLAAFPSCSLVNAGFDECQNDVQCGVNGVCADRYCLPLPAQCRRHTGAFDHSNAIKIAALLPLSPGQDGGMDAREVAGLKAIELAVEDVNNANGLEGRLFSLYLCDTGRTDRQLIVQETFLVKQLRVPALITSGTQQTQAAALYPGRLEAGTLIVSATATGSQLSRAFSSDGTTWRIAPPDTLHSRVIVRTLTRASQYATDGGIAVVYDNELYEGKELSSLVEAGLTALGKTVFLAKYQRDTLDVPALTSTLSQSHGTAAPRVTVFIGLPHELNEILANTATSARLSWASGHRWFLTDSARDPEILMEPTVRQLSHALGTAPAQGAGPAFEDFRSRLRDRFELDASSFPFTAQSYDAAFLVMLSAAFALREGGELSGGRMSEAFTRFSSPTGRSFRVGAAAWVDAAKQLAEGNEVNMEGASGSLDFDLDAGAPTAPYEIWEITDAGVLATQSVELP